MSKNTAKVGLRPRVGRPAAAGGPLANWLLEKQIDRNDFAQILKIDRKHLDHICKGTRRPSLDLASRIEIATGGEVKAVSFTATKPRR